MAHNHRQQNESGRWQDYPRGGFRNPGDRERNDFGRDRYETGSERRYSPDFDEQRYRYYEGSGQYADASNSFEGDRSYSAGGYPEEFGYRRGGQERGSSYRSSGYQDEFNRGGRGNNYGSPQRYGSGNYSHYGSEGSLGRDYGGEQYGQQSQQSYRGRGPKGYERSDERLKEMVCERLTDDPMIDASEVSIEVTNKTVRLTGTVDDRRIKYMIEDVIEQVGGVRDIDNQLRVQSQPTSQSPTSQYGAGTSEGSFGARGSDNRIGTTSTGLGSPSTKRN